jgi:hypothetical protein
VKKRRSGGGEGDSPGRGRAGVIYYVMDAQIGFNSTAGFDNGIRSEKARCFAPEAVEDLFNAVALRWFGLFDN